MWYIYMRHFVIDNYMHILFPVLLHTLLNLLEVHDQSLTKITLVTAQRTSLPFPEPELDPQSRQKLHSREVCDLLQQRRN